VRVLVRACDPVTDQWHEVEVCEHLTGHKDRTLVLLSQGKQSSLSAVMANRRLHSKRKKRKALATHHLFFVNQIIYRRRGARISG
jgi:hypothetical protein